MKITEAQSAVLSNYEVYQHLFDQKQQYKKAKRRGPPNLETVVSELLQYMDSKPNPLSQKPVVYSPESITTIVDKLRPYELSKGEVVMIINLRPSSVVALNTVLEDMADRYTEEQQEEMVQTIQDVLGQFEAASAEEQEEADVAMADAS